MRTTLNDRFNLRRQSGAALIVGLVLMMVLTILAISTMRTATLELSMAGNTQYREKARQLAEAGLADAMDQINDGLIPLTATDPGIWTNGVIIGNLEPLTGDTYSVDIRFLNVGDPPTGSLGREDLQANYFELQSTGTTAARNARSVLRQGFYIFAN